jgi:hypothetical protein
MRTVIAHGHIFKNAGTTLDWALRRNLGEGFCDHREDKRMRVEGAPYLNQYLLENAEIKAISSHHMCDVSSIEEIDMIPIYMLRHPIERILSVYNFERRQQASTPGAVAAKKYNFKDYVRWRMDPQVNRTIRNYQTVYLAGLHTREASKECTLDIFHTATTKLEDSLVGLVEQFDMSMIRFEEFLKNRGLDVDLSYTKQNVSSEDSKPSGNKVSYIAQELGDVFDDVLSNNAYDLALHNAATQLFEKPNIQNYPEKLADFKHRCARLE